MKSRRDICSTMNDRTPKEHLLTCLDYSLCTPNLCWGLGCANLVLSTNYMFGKTRVVLCLNMILGLTSWF